MAVSKYQELEDRTLKFAISVRKFIKKLPRDIGNIEDSKQVVRSLGSVGANYIEANESLGDKDKLMRLRISRKECKETIFWLKCIKASNDFSDDHEIGLLIRESEELLKILSSIIDRLSRK
ncbi:MAG: four helix bundle protein [Salinivirgaceae bacterium]|nr:four helix bundle protein [Salinivirgaceae bacterium]